jgi:hypothetical protein
LPWLSANGSKPRLSTGLRCAGEELVFVDVAACPALKFEEVHLVRGRIVLGVGGSWFGHVGYPDVQIMILFSSDRSDREDYLGGGRKLVYTNVGIS